MVPNNVVLRRRSCRCASPPAVDLRARLRPDVKPSDVQAHARGRDQHARARRAAIALEEVDADEVVVRIQATPRGRRRRPAAGRRGPGRDRRRHARRRGRGCTPAGDDGARSTTAPADDADRPRRVTQQLRGASACRAGRGRSASAISSAPSRRWTRRRPGARPRARRRARSDSGATSISARLCSIAWTTARATSSGVLVPT